MRESPTSGLPACEVIFLRRRGRVELGFGKPILLAPPTAITVDFDLHPLLADLDENFLQLL